MRDYSQEKEEEKEMREERDPDPFNDDLLRGIRTGMSLVRSKRHPGVNLTHVASLAMSHVLYRLAFHFRRFRIAPIKYYDGCL